MAPSIGGLWDSLPRGDMEVTLVGLQGYQHLQEQEHQQRKIHPTVLTAWDDTEGPAWPGPIGPTMLL
jgi:hypothetical protein